VKLKGVGFRLEPTGKVGDAVRYHEAHASQTRLADEELTQGFEAAPLRADRAASVERLSDAEIAQLVSVALNDALRALRRADPEGALRSRARAARLELRAIFVSLPWVQRTDPTVVTEYRKAIECQNLGLELGLKFVEVIGRYAELSDRRSTLEAV